MAASSIALIASAYSRSCRNCRTFSGILYSALMVLKSPFNASFSFFAAVPFLSAVLPVLASLSAASR